MKATDLMYNPSTRNTDYAGKTAVAACEAIRKSITLADAGARAIFQKTADLHRAEFAKRGLDTDEKIAAFAEETKVAMAEKKARDEKTNTYDGWKAEGRQVSRGQKACGKNSEGVSVFQYRQTEVAAAPKVFANANRSGGGRYNAHGLCRLCGSYCYGDCTSND